MKEYYKRVKKWALRRTRIIIPVIILLLTIITYYLKVIPDDYRANLVTELVGALITVIIIDYLYQLKDSNDNKELEQNKVQSMNNLIKIYIDEYLRHIYIMINPFGNTKKELTSIQISDLQFLYSNSSLRFAPFFVKNYQLYFDNLKRLTEAVKQQIVTLDTYLSKDLIEVLQTLIKNNDSDVLYLMIHERTQTVYGDKQAFQEDVEWLKNQTVTPEYSSVSSTNDVYISLYKTIKENLETINQYMNYIQRLK